MSEALFERYLRNQLDEAGARELAALLSTEEGARAFSEFVQEWTLLGEAALQRVAEADRQGNRKIRKRAPAPQPGRAWIGWAAGFAAAALFMIALVTPGRMPSPKEEKPLVRTAPAAPVRAETPPAPPAEPERPPAPRPEPERAPLPPAPAPPLPPAPTPPTPSLPVELPREKIPETRPAEAEKPARTVVALMGRVAGDVHVVSPAGRRTAVAGEGLAPEEGVEVVRGAAGIEFPDGTRIDLGPDSTVERLQERQGKRGFTLSRGSVSATVLKQPAGRSVGVTTPHAEITVLGTQFSVAVTPESTRLEVREGRVRMTRTPDGASVEVAAGHTSIAAKGQKLESKPTLHTRDFQDGPGYAGTRDTSISGADPSRAFGTAEVLEVDGDEVDGKKIYGLIKWDLSDLPPGAVVRSAVITLNVVDASLGRGYSFYEMKRGWSEADATWLLAAPQQPWRVPGIKSTLERGAEALGTVAPRVKGPIPILLTPAAEAVIQGWIRKPESNHGFLIANDTNSDGFKYHSRESAAPDLRPKLTLTYTVAPR
ncbi:MAG: FecR domain-containing protein [Planctomycetes bacterium]|nr:FecR domain-containing protein [Planctomycetota bacterium]